MFVFICLDLYWSIPKKSIEPALQTYYNDSLELFEIGCPRIKQTLYKRTTVQFVDRFPQKNTIGMCFILGKEMFLFIHKGFWQSPDTSSIERATLFLHEMSHCVLKAEHSKNKDNFMYDFLPIYPDNIDSYASLLTDAVNLAEKKCPLR